MTEARLNKGRTQREVLINKMRRIDNFITENLKTATIPELELRAGHIEIHFKEFNTSQFDLEVYDKEELATDFREKFEEQYYRIKPQIRVELNEHLTKWLDFYESFITLVHKNCSLNDITRFQYLRNLVDGSAAQTIAALELNSENYKIALNLFHDRFNDKKAICQEHIRSLFLLKKIEIANSDNLRSIIDTVNSHLRSLSTLGRPTPQWDDLIVHIIYSRLDKDTCSKWDDESAVDRLPTLDELFKFLNRRSLSLRNKSINTSKPTSNTFNKNPSSFKRQSYHTSSVTSTSKYSCAFCEKKGHSIFRCTRFLTLLPSDRVLEINKRNVCSNCLNKTHKLEMCEVNEHCHKCQDRHHTLLHCQTISEEDANVSVPHTSAVATPDSNTIDSTVILHSSNLNNIDNSTLPNSLHNSYVYLATAIVKLRDKNDSEIYCRALLDSGSQVNFITEALANQLGVKPINSSVTFAGVGHSNIVSKNKCLVNLKSRVSGFTARFETFILPKITERQPSVKIKLANWHIPKNIQLADTQFSDPHKIDLLIGAELYYDILSVGQIKQSEDLPILQNTVLGWAISGKAKLTSAFTHIKPICSIVQLTNESDLNDQIERFWRIENMEREANAMYTPEEEACETHFVQNTKRDSDGRFLVKLPLKSNPSVLGNSQGMALSRFHNLERKLSKSPELHLAYSQFMTEYEELGPMEIVPNSKISPVNFYLPHHCVIKSDSSSTKLRVVFDASAKSSSNISLNDIMMVGPVVQNDLFSILIRFRAHRYVFSADICKMYRQINIDNNDSNLQYIFWRKNPSDDLQIFKLTTITYGTASAPYLATRCLKQLTIDEAQRFPLAINAILNDTYVDDILTGSNSLTELLQIKSNLNGMLHSAGMLLRKWCSNNEKIIADVPVGDRESLLNIDEQDTVKTLGLYWQPSPDKFKFHVSLPDCKNKVTKRTVISDIARIFDPLGLISPSITLCKIFMQRLWQLKLDWDEALPQQLYTRWLNYRDELHNFNKISIERYLFSTSATKYIQIHGFCDASEKAYGAVLYSRVETINGSILVNLICSKSRVAPLKNVSLPRLELCAAQLLVNLFQQLKPSLNFEFEKIFYWTDSTIVLQWIRSPAALWNTFVANRVSNIQQFSSTTDWNHIDSKRNAADMISRGLMPSELLNSNFWFHGPLFLTESQLLWPKSKNEITYNEIPERRNEKKCVLVSSERIDSLFDRLKHKNNFKSIRNTMGYVYRFIQNSRKKHLGVQNRLLGSLTQDELQHGLLIIIREIQSIEFCKEIQLLESGKSNEIKGSLKPLSVFLDKHKILRVGGRLSQSTISYSTQHPIVLPTNHEFTTAVANYFHFRMLHVGPQGLLAAIREKYWPINGRRLCSKIFRNCLICAKARPRILSQLMGSLPAERIRCTPPFMTVGVDFCGPFYVHYRIRGRVPTKCYLAIFVCFVVKAVHIELVADLTTAAFIGAMKRFIATRGACKTIFSDNATNFVGANTELHTLYKLFKDTSHNEEVLRLCQDEGITWNFAPPSSPNFGGLYEAAVKSAKFHLRRIVGNAVLTYEELNTLIKQVEAVLNSRPLTPMSGYPDDLEALTPGHFIIGRPLTTIIEPDITAEKSSTLQKWRLIQCLHQTFWSRWQKEYLTNLQQRYSWSSSKPKIKIDDFVLLKDDNLPPLKWKMGRILEVHPGPDGLIRVVTIKTSTGNLKRAISKVCPLPLQDDVSVESS